MALATFIASAAPLHRERARPVNPVHAESVANAVEVYCTAANAATSAALWS